MIIAAPFCMLRTIIFPVIVICFTLTSSFGQEATAAGCQAITGKVAGDDSSSKANQPPADAPAANSSTGAQSGAASGNENVLACKLDSDSQMADDQQLGFTYDTVSKPVVETSFYAAECGQATAGVPRPI